MGECLELWGLGGGPYLPSVASGIHIDELRTEVERRFSPAAEPGGLLVIDGIAEDPHPEDADIILRFVDLYDGDDPNLRRTSQTREIGRTT